MKIHYNAASPSKNTIYIACGIGGQGIPATRMASLVTCKKCLTKIPVVRIPSSTQIFCYDHNFNIVEWKP